MDFNSYFLDNVQVTRDWFSHDLQ